MGGINLEYEERWVVRQTPWGGELEFSRRHSGRLRDREAFTAIINTLRELGAGAAPSLTINDQETSLSDPLAILDEAGPTVRNVFMSTPNREFIVQLYSRPGPVTLVRGPATHPGTSRLVSLVDAHTRWRGWRAGLGRFRVLRWAAPSVIVRATRDSRTEARARWIAIGFGFLGGVAASVIATVLGAALGAP
jgi:hypothetical protein